MGLTVHKVWRFSLFYFGGGVEVRKEERERKKEADESHCRMLNAKLTCTKWSDGASLPSVSQMLSSGCVSEVNLTQATAPLPVCLPRAAPSRSFIRFWCFKGITFLWR